MRHIVIVLCLLFLAACATSRPAPGTDAEPLARQLRAALAEDPDLVLDILRENDIAVYEIASQGAEHKHRQQQAEQMASELANPLKPVIDPARPVRGDADAPVTIVSYSDFLCSWCARGAQTMEQLLERYKGKVRVIDKHNPRSEESARAALYYEALGEQDPALSLALYDRIFADQQPLAERGEAFLKELAAELGADMGRLAADLQREDVQARISADVAEAESFGFSGTPMYVVGGVSVRGAKPVEDFAEIVDLVLERRGAQ